MYLDLAPTVEPRPNSVVLTTADTFDPARGLGWVRPPSEGFTNPDFGPLRSPALNDGVAGTDFSLRLNLAPGPWTALVFIDDGYSNAHQVAIDVDGHPIVHSTRRFGVDAE
ncbi:MAG: hypothetical protein IAE82_17105, partial [Opitutaceae bacterium]|nr:hypothetical protein [Opitutaceae bacterium]